MNWEISEDTSVAEVVTQYPQTRMLPEEMGIDNCCGGKHSLKDACNKSGTVFVAAGYMHCDSLSELDRNTTVLSAPESRVAP